MYFVVDYISSKCTLNMSPQLLGL